MNPGQPLPLIVRRPQLKQLVGISPATAHRLENDPCSGFPRRRQWGAGRIVGWAGAELEVWVEQRGQVIEGRRNIAGKPVIGG